MYLTIWICIWQITSYIYDEGAYSPNPPVYIRGITVATVFSNLNRNVHRSYLVFCLRGINFFSPSFRIIHQIFRPLNETQRRSLVLMIARVDSHYVKFKFFHFVVVYVSASVCDSLFVPRNMAVHARSDQFETTRLFKIIFLIFSILHKTVKFNYNSNCVGIILTIVK